MLMVAIERAGRVPGDEVAIALDPAATELFRDGSYVLAGEGRTLSAAELAAYWSEIVGALPDHLDRGRDGRGGLGGLGVRSPSAIGDRVQLVGDDLFVTNVERLDARHRARRGQRRADQGQPDRDAHRDAAHDVDGDRGTVTAR